jgi:VanZ family protein
MLHAYEGISMRLLFSFLSIFYIAAIFLFAGAPMVSDLAPFNPYSLLHIPLYGILTVLLIFSFVPIKLNRVNILSHLRFNFKSHIPNGHNASTPSRISASTHSKLQTSNSLPSPERFAQAGELRILPGVISLIIAIADEIHQSFIPTRNASVIDVFLDALGIALAIYFVTRLYKNKKIMMSLQP